MKQKTRILIYILIAAAVVIIGAIAILSGGKTGDSVQNHLDLGRKYLEELSYDEAELEFYEAIRIDPADPEPYIELADLYTNTDRAEMAVDILETGYRETEDENILKVLRKLDAKPNDNNNSDDEDSLAGSEAGDGGEQSEDDSTAGGGNTSGGSANEELVEVPDLIGLSEEEAVSLCEERGFLHSVSRQNSNDVKKGIVMGQTIPAGTMAAKGIGIPFAVSEGKVMVELPELSGLSEEEARRVCSEIGIDVNVSYESSNDVNEGFVISQNIPAGAKAAEGASVKIVVSEGCTVKVELLAQVEFDYLADFESSGWAFAVKGNKGGYVNLNGKFVEVYDDVQKLDENGKYGDRYYECNGPCLYFVNGMPMKEDDFQSGPDAEYYIDPFKINPDGIYPYCRNGKWGYANINTGEIIIPCQYNEVSYFNCGRCFVSYDDPNYVKYEPKPGEAVVVSDYIPQITKILDINGNEINLKTDKEISSYRSFCYINNTALICDDWSNFILIDVNGYIINDDIQVCPYEIYNTKYNKEAQIFTYICDFDFDSYTWKTVFIDENGKQICSLNGQYYVVAIDGRYALCSHSIVNNFYTKRSIIDLKDGGKIVGQFEIGEYNDCNIKFGNNLIARGKNREKFTLFDFNGTRLIDSEYDFIGNPSYERIGIKKNDKWGLIDPNGNLKIDFIYDNIYWYINFDEIGLFMLCEDSISSLLIDSDGNEMYRFKYSLEYLDNIDGNTYVVTKIGNKYMIYKISE